MARSCRFRYVAQWSAARNFDRYGRSLRSDPRYTGRQWTDIEDDLLHDFEQETSATAWHKAKAVANKAWSKVPQ